MCITFDKQTEAQALLFSSSGNSNVPEKESINTNGSFILFFVVNKIQ